ncbi:uncharacterized protein LOC124930078 [Impatiens glandulifera]|uniref:uncharacterized protein LOC124930078 n=1 Tax=Impatiens glandulifera TaxID=253017 RepID=UPI001FB0EDE1|nr:uncharacterized protein LOC124930078 [Impatiens glandulifera]
MDSFSQSVEAGLNLSYRIYYGKERSIVPPNSEEMERSKDYFPKSPMVYAVISEPAIVDNPDVPSYQPYVYGRCEPPAFIPLHMHAISMEVDCYLDTAFVTVSGTWHVHCVMASKSCECRVAIPMGEQGSILGVEVDVSKRAFHTELITVEDENIVKAKDGVLLKGYVYTLKIPKVDGGATINVKMTWSQKVLYRDNEFFLDLPFSFPAYVRPVGRKITKREKIVLNVNTGIAAEVVCRSSSHPLKEVWREVGKLGFLYEAEVPTWSTRNLSFSYTITSGEIFGELLFQSASAHDIDQRDMFCLYLVPGNLHDTKVFTREVVFVVDISGSMIGGALDNVKHTLRGALMHLDEVDSFNIIGFNGETKLFSTCMVLANRDAIESALQWMDAKLTADGGTNILLPLNQALEMVGKTSHSLPIIFLITDGTVEDERHICTSIRSNLTSKSVSPQICTFGIGMYCNHYFLQMLAHIGKGFYDAAFDVDSINHRLERLLYIASSIVLANITIQSLDHLDSLELYPNDIPDLSSRSPLIVSGRYNGKLPESVKVSGTLPDMSTCVVDLKIQKVKDMPLDRVVARRQIDILTAYSWLSESKQLEQKIAQLSIQTGFPSEFSRMILVQTEKSKTSSDLIPYEEKTCEANNRKIMLRSLGIGFGNLVATLENHVVAMEETRLHETSDKLTKAAAHCCSVVLDRICCMCLLQACSRMNDRFAIALTQLCGAFACVGCIECCCDLCVSCD